MPFKESASELILFGSAFNLNLRRLVRRKQRDITISMWNIIDLICQYGVDNTIRFHGEVYMEPAIIRVDSIGDAYYLLIRSTEDWIDTT